jgi:hypothetical protein
MFDNTFGGASVVEVIVVDPNRSRTDISQGEPVVKVDENQLRMAQGVDGNWYGYFGDEAKIELSDAATNNLDYGNRNDKANANTALVRGDFNEAVDVTSAIALGGPNSLPGVVTNAPVLSTWNGTGAISSDLTGTGAAVNGTKGQIGIPSDNDWPIIQLYTLTSSTGT